MINIEKIIKNKIFLSNGEVLSVNSDIKSMYNLREGMNIDGLYDEISYETSFIKALYLLGLKDRTKEELRIKLNEKIKNKQAIERVVNKMEESGYINDGDYAVNYVKNSRYGLKRTEFELLKRGISKENIKKALLEVENNEYNKLEKAIEKVKNKDEHKIISYLLRQGFELEDILDRLKDIKEEIV